MYLNYRELDADIIIIGAGIVGLSAAFHLLDKDPHIDFLILDVDGRIRKETRAKFADDTFYEDFQFICCKQTNLMNLLEILNIPVVKNEVENGKILVDYDEFYEVSKRENILDFFSLRERLILNSFCRQINYLCKDFSFGVKKIQPEFDDISMDTLFNRMITSKKVRDVISQIFLCNLGLQPKDISASFFLAYCNSIQGIQNQFIWNEEGIHQCYIKGGVESIRYKLRNLIGEESIIKVPEVTEISWDDYSAGIKTPQDYFFANNIVFTLNESETNNIDFVPPLSEEKKAVADSVVRGTLKKFIVRYDKPFWLNRGLSGDVYVMNTVRRNGPICICVNVSKIAENNYTLTGLADEESNETDILNQLVMYFGVEAEDPEDYQEIPSSLLDLSFSYGCKSMKYFGNTEKSCDRIVWTSSETATKWYGTTAGSIEAGFKGAITALYEVKPNTLSINDLHIVSPDEVFIPPRIVGLFGIQWHLLIPAIILISYAAVRVKKLITKKLLK